ncbi:hypothetical protein LOC54_04595 [Acetobacter sp. AN02]|uniref:hypothetical protein n=1 Tax=Acetobacter sp. AN02 TaxID=2894186 RepID=UPI0024340C82|nr:hypothetical protein [Acetobacter sp. AN02]MDG6094397.1 hypothetical protein [Acetobacter sp. AN02]
MILLPCIALWALALLCHAALQKNFQRRRAWIPGRHMRIVLRMARGAAIIAALTLCLACEGAAGIVTWCLAAPAGGIPVSLYLGLRTPVARQMG